MLLVNPAVLFYPMMSLCLMILSYSVIFAYSIILLLYAFAVKKSRFSDLSSALLSNSAQMLANIYMAPGDAETESLILLSNLDIRLVLTII